MEEPSPKRLRSDVSSPAARLRELLNQNQCHTVLGCYDCVSAKAIQKAGFSVCFMSGYAVSASRLGMPDVGLCTYSEMVDCATNICRCVGEKVCVIGDGDTGYGGMSNLRRTVEGYARAGLAGITIEDQVFPKRCAYAEGVDVVSRDEALARLRAALLARDEMRARTGLDLVVIARTDARRVAPASNSALVEALWRCRAFEDLGADVVYAEGLRTEVEMRALNTCMKKGTPTMIAQVEAGGATPVISSPAAGALGFKLCLFGVTMLNAHLSTSRRVSNMIKSGEHPHVGKELLPFQDLYQAVGFDEAYAWEARAGRETGPDKQGDASSVQEGNGELHSTGNASNGI